MARSRKTRSFVTMSLPVMISAGTVEYAYVKRSLRPIPWKKTKTTIFNAMSTHVDHRSGPAVAVVVSNRDHSSRVWRPRRRVEQSGRSSPHQPFDPVTTLCYLWASRRMQAMGAVDCLARGWGACMMPWSDSWTGRGSGHCHAGLSEGRGACRRGGDEGPRQYRSSAEGNGLSHLLDDQADHRGGRHDPGGGMPARLDDPWKGSFRSWPTAGCYGDSMRRWTTRYPPKGPSPCAIC